MSKISIAMAVYNGEKYLLEQLESIAKQSLLPIELIVVNDASTDNSLAILERFAEKAPFIVKIIKNKQNFGSNKSFAKAIRHTSGDFIALADQDDVWMENKLLVLMNALKENPKAGYAFSNAFLTDEFLEINQDQDLWKVVKWAIMVANNKINAFPLVIYHPFVTGTTMMFNKNLKEYIRRIPSKIIHDHWISIIGEVSGKTGVAVNEKLVLYRQHLDQQIGAQAKSRKKSSKDKLLISLKKKQLCFLYILNLLENKLIVPRFQKHINKLFLIRKILELEVHQNTLRSTGVKTIWRQVIPNIYLLWIRLLLLNYILYRFLHYLWKTIKLIFRKLI